MQNPWSSYMMPSEGSGEWEATSPLVHPGGSSYLDKVRAGETHRRGRDGGDGASNALAHHGGHGGRGGHFDLGGGHRHKTGHGHDGGDVHGAQSAASSTTPYAARKPEGYMDAYALEGIVADTTVGGAGGAIGPGGAGGHKGDGKEGKDGRDAKDAQKKSVVSSSTASCSNFLNVPSGKRAQGEGCEDASQARRGLSRTSTAVILQGILAAHFSPSTMTAVLQITYLAAGFLIGEKGQSIRDMERMTSTSIKSWKDRTAEGRSVRKLVIESVDDVGADRKDGYGAHVGMENVARCLHIIKAAVMHYKDLCEGLYCGEYVEPVRVIEGVAFHYCPPPRKMVPYAAGITVKASKVVDAYGGGTAEVPSRYKKEVRGAPWNGSHEVMDILEWEGVGVDVDVDRGAPGMADMAQIPEKKDKGARTRRKEARAKRGNRKGSGGESGASERGDGEGMDDETREVDLQVLHNHPEFGLFEVPCDEDYQPKEWDWTRRRQRQRVSNASNDVHAVQSNPPKSRRSPGLPNLHASSPANAWSNPMWGPNGAHPLRQQELEARSRAATPTPFGLTLHFSPWAQNAGLAMPWTGMDTLSGVSQQSVLKGHDNGYNNYHAYDRHGAYDGWDGLGGFDDGCRSGGLDRGQLIPSAWEDVSGHPSLLSSRMFSQIHGQAHDQAGRPRKPAPSRNAFSSCDFAQKVPSREPSLENIFAEFSEKCSVGDHRCGGSSRWMETPTRHAVGMGGQDDVKDDVDPAPIERSRRRLNF